MTQKLLKSKSVTVDAAVCEKDVNINLKNMKTDKECVRHLTLTAGCVVIINRYQFRAAAQVPKSFQRSPPL